MDVPSLQEWFSGYIQSLFATGYLNRSQFKPFYAATMATHGSTSYPISVVLNNTMTMVQIMVIALAAPEPDFPRIVEFAQQLGDSARSIGALRTANLTVFLKVFAEVAHQHGCLAYLHMLTTEIEALDYCFCTITELETAFTTLGLAVPFDW